jgi:hypothetical protein
LRQGFIRVYRLEMQSVMLVFSTQHCELLPLITLSLVLLSPLPLPHVSKYSLLYTRIQCVGRGGWGVLGLTDKHLLQSPFTGQFFRCRRFALSSLSLIFTPPCNAKPRIELGHPKNILMATRQMIITHGFKARNIYY